jgi:hypothetical protein
MPQPFLNGSILYSTTAWPFLPQKQIAVRSSPKERKHLSTPFHIRNTVAAKTAQQRPLFRYYIVLFAI